ncbi:MAG: uracil-DNA glycosylase [Pseudomonadota bacterium]
MTETSHAYLRAMGIDYFVARANSDSPGAPAESPGLPEAALELVRSSASLPVGSNPQPTPSMPIENVERPPVVAADNWAELEAQVNACRACTACESRTQPLLGSGASDAKWLFVTDSPSADQDQSGDVFAGPGGVLLKDMLFALGLDASNAYSTPLLKCRTPGGRDPVDLEITQCSEYLQAQIKLLRPSVIVALGRVAAQTLTGSDAPLARLRGHIHTTGKFSAPVVASYRPEYLLQSPAKKASSWQDLKLALKALGDEA